LIIKQAGGYRQLCKDYGKYIFSMQAVTTPHKALSRLAGLLFY